ncbi:MAG TPA: hypothetical protein VK583_13900 [Burkholderiales bacterium]|jgi:hypothetical protein|nr:hypothetical protein [Burkholderiales bacterium]
MKLIGIVGGIGPEYIGMTLLDTARLHVEAAVSELLADEAR